MTALEPAIDYGRLAADDPRHGTLTAYTGHACRCPACRAAGRAYKARLAAIPLAADDPRHGIASTYNSYRCRCPECRRAWTAYRRRFAKNGRPPRTRR